MCSCLLVYGGRTVYNAVYGEQATVLPATRNPLLQPPVVGRMHGQSGLGQFAIKPGLNASATLPSNTAEPPHSAAGL
jgi:hypothetical protein